MKHVQRPKGEGYKREIVSSSPSLHHYKKIIVLESTLKSFNSGDIIHTFFDKGVHVVNKGLFDYEEYSIIPRFGRDSTILRLDFPLPDDLIKSLRANPDRAWKMKIPYLDALALNSTVEVRARRLIIPQVVNFIQKRSERNYLITMQGTATERTLDNLLKLLEGAIDKCPVERVNSYNPRSLL